jgi:hypothetical protein
MIRPSEALPRGLLAEQWLMPTIAERHPTVYSAAGCITGITSSDDDEWQCDGGWNASTLDDIIDLQRTFSSD